MSKNLNVKGVTDHFKLNYRYFSKILRYEAGLTAEVLGLELYDAKTLPEPTDIKRAKMTTVF